MFTVFRHSKFEILESTFKVKVYHYDKPTSTKETLMYDGWIYPSGRKIVANKTQHHVETALKIIADLGRLNEFESANKNHGYDACEYLILVLGFIAIRNRSIVYSSDLMKTKRPNTRLLNFLDIELLYKQNKFEDYPILIPTKKDSDINEHEYYKSVENRFHCPSGTPRMDYLAYLKRNKH